MMFLILGLVATACQTIEGERITARDLGRVAPEFAALPPDTPLGYAPLPGAHRDLTVAAIQRLAEQNGIKAKVSGPVCFEWAMRRLDRAEVVEAMRGSLGETQFEVSEYSLFLAPPGKVVFPVAGLGNSFWRGYVLYAGDRRFNIWAKVQVAAQAADVRNGERVTVVARSGGAEIKLDGQAVSAGVKGQTVLVRNLASGKTFKAEVTGKNSVLVNAVETRE
jgi:hypothetical protein